MSPHSETSQESLPHINLTYFIWLPAGKDEFGFEHYEDAPFNDTAFHRTLGQLERTISHHFEENAKGLRGENKLAFMEPVGPLTPTDGELGLRKTHFGFTYEHNYADLNPYVRRGPIPGTAIFFSNGLYLWSFRIPLKEPVAEAEQEAFKEVLKGFLKHDFVGRHLKHLFDFDWNPGEAGGRPDDYAGILTYYQLDLLFNGVLDPSAHPHLSLGEQRPAAGKQDETRNLEEKARQKYDVQYLIESLSLCAVGREYVPLFDLRKKYSLRRTHGDGKAYVDSGVSLEARHLAVDDDDGLHQRELFLSRLSFAAMEQFLRVTISFGLSHYKNGLDHIRSELVSQGMQARKNRPSGELRRPSLASRALTLVDLEAYHALLAGKIPILRFLHDLVVGLSQVTQPAITPKANGVDGAVEWTFSLHTLQEAQTQFRRQIDAISADLTAIESSLTAVRADLMLLELTESRKISEIAAESPRSEVRLTGGTVTLSDKWEKGLNLRLALFALLIGLMEIFSSLGVWIVDKAFSGPRTPWRWSQVAAVGYWVIVFSVVAVVFYLGMRLIRRPETEPDEPHERGSDKLETHVFDYSSLLREVRAGKGRSSGVMDRVANSMIDIENPHMDRGSCTSFSTFHETPSSGIEHIKYSLESPLSQNGLTYILHVEFDRRLSGDTPERLLDVRLVVRRPVIAPKVELAPNIRHVISECVQLLLFPDGNEAAMGTFFLERFGWEWPPSQTGPAA